MSPAFTLTKQTSDALIRTCRCTAMLADDLLQDGYEFVLTARVQSDPLERGFGKVRRMSGGRFLVGLTEFNNSQNILILSSLLKEDVSFWDEDVYETDTVQNEQLDNLMKEVSLVSSEIYECSLGKESREVSVTVAGYVAKKINEKMKCDVCEIYLVCKDDETREGIDDDYLSLLSRSGLTFPGKYLADFVSHAFAVLDLVDALISKYPNLNVRRAAGNILSEYLDGWLSCVIHHDKVKRLAINCIINIFYNNKQKRAADEPRKDDLKTFKQRQLRDPR